MNETEMKKATAEMQIFFERLLDFKQFVKEKTNEYFEDEILREIYEKLDALIKEANHA